MTNYEFYKNEIIEAVIHGETCEFKKGYVFKRKSCKNAQCSECSCKTKEWFNSEHKEPIKLSKFEYDLLDTVSGERNGFKFGNHQFKAMRNLVTMKEKGHFKGIDVEMTLEEILNSCEVVND